LVSGRESLASSTPRTGRGLGMTTALVVMVVVIVLVGGAGYVALSVVPGRGTGSVTTCSPSTNPVCQATSGINDVVLTVPFQAGIGQAIASSQQGISIPATVAVLNGESVSAFRIFWGDGSNYTGGNPTSNHDYTGLGWYVINAQALVGSVWHSGPAYLYPIQITPNIQTQSSGFYPTLTTTFSNGSSAATQFGWFSGSGSVAVSGVYTYNSTAGGYTDQPPTLTSTGGTESHLVSTSTSVAATYSFAGPGLYYITMVGPVSGPTGPIYQNYTWTVYVAPTGVSPGCGACHGPNPSAKSPHSGVILEEADWGSPVSMDPSVAYDGVSPTAFFSVYQTLVTYNWTSTTSYLPQLSLCVPGPGCAAMFGGNSLIVNNQTSATPEFWTFPIDPAAHFYDPSTGGNWSVYPSDVVFSLARTCGFADLPGVGIQPGWIQCQALLPMGNAAWDAGIHAPYNNTPQSLLDSMRVNDSAYCPASVMAVSNGCITFDAWGGAVPGVSPGAAWPFFLQLITDPEGADIEPCGWFTYHNAGVPGFNGTTAAHGDGPCYLPGSSPRHPITNTTDPAWKSYLGTLSPTYWDSFELLALDAPGIQPNVQWNLVGSGPYFVANQPFQQSVGFTLEQNPAYQAPTGCKGQPHCQPLPGPMHYAGKVTVVFQSTDTVGIEDYNAGLTDFASIESSETGELLSLVSEGKIGVFSFPSFDIETLGFAQEFNLATARMLDPEVLNIPSNFFNYIGLREFLVNAFPYTTVEDTINTVDGIQYGVNFGGWIPQGMGNYYPTNISWPSGDPVANPTVNGSAAWWWAQATNQSSPYYDSYLGNCTSDSPCQFPITLPSGAPALDEMIQDYVPFIDALSHGRLVPNLLDIPYAEYVLNSWGNGIPGKSGAPFTLYPAVPDYPDPTDYTAVTYYPNGAYTSGLAFSEGLSPWTCGSSHDAPPGMPAPDGSMAALLFWAHQPGIPQACQGDAYSAMYWGLSQAATMTIGPGRVLLYNLAEHIANHLALYVYMEQQNYVSTYASWINPNTLNLNVMQWPGGLRAWYLIGGNGVFG